ncbi:hypothetical protein Back11_41200 [Paenibacillus baekrokdamisoli]|uniref:DUF4097 domain-containing protein n=1 Tax=Paenibacillus baekrokdamisoli TaxID=1712516 RepID=A0A3G9J362_9BACL|nr:DUF4097 family beta strand repeat-containing protein [Paenibacillus baekrokdamisoli]MBB3068180.1 hypothetical protein [Paenibacillus baekrokdamisoli]BBH22775.1 hypothetical protein Back11_41200 [Paenibacillus baekrokdamisoli]
MRNWIVIALILLVIGIIGMFGTFKDGNWLSLGTEKVEQKQSLEAAGIHNIHVELGSTNVKVVPTSSSEIKATLSGSASKKYKGKLHLMLEREGDTAKLTYEDDIGFSIGFNILNVDIKLELPEAQWQSFILNSSSGNIEISKLSADSIVLEGSSGNIELSQLKTHSLSAMLSSGNMDVLGITAETTRLESTSGNITLQDLKGDMVTVDVGSGNIKLLDVDAKLKADTSSGDIRAELQALEKSMAFDASSGNVTILSDKQPDSVQIKFNTSSGNLNNDWDGGQKSTNGEDVESLTFGNSGVQIAVDTGSGNLSVGPR